MGTNYYLKIDECSCCGRPKEELHIGKYSGGWKFALNSHPYQGISNLEDWKHAFNQPKNKIYSEYGVERTIEEMLETIQEVGLGGRPHKVDGRHCLGNFKGYDIMHGEFC